MERPTTEMVLMAPSLTNLREKLGRKAKEEPTFRFYTLYGHISRWDVLEAAWKKIKQGGKAPGIDGVTVEEIERSPGGHTQFLAGIRESLKLKTYQVAPVKRVYIPKPNGQQRPLGIPTIKDRVVQTALLMILEPIFEMDFHDCSYGFRPGRSAHQAIQRITEAVHDGYRAVYDADLKGYFDSIPHEKLMKAVRQRVVDRWILRLIRMWLQAPIVEPKGALHKPKQGTPQGGVISPLLANIYLHWLDEVFHRRWGSRWASARLIRFADDFVVMCRQQLDDVRNFVEEKVEAWLGLEINREKTQCIDLNDPKVGLDFLGYTIRYLPSRKYPGKRYCYIIPAAKSEAKARDRLRELIGSSRGNQPVANVVMSVNRFLKGWNGYFKLGHPSRAYNRLNYFVGKRLTRHLLRRSQRGYRLREGESWYGHFCRLGLYRLRKV